MVVYNFTCKITFFFLVKRKRKDFVLDLTSLDYFYSQGLSYRLVSEDSNSSYHTEQTVSYNQTDMQYVGRTNCWYAKPGTIPGIPMP